MNEIEVARDGEETLNFLFYREKFKNMEQIRPIVILLDIKILNVTKIDVLMVIKKEW